MNDYWKDEPTGHELGKSYNYAHIKIRLETYEKFKSLKGQMSNPVFIERLLKVYEQSLVKKTTEIETI